MSKTKKHNKTEGCVLFIIPRAYEKIDPVSDRLYESHALTSVIHCHPNVLDNNKMIEDRMARYGKILCAVYPDDNLICDEWFFEEMTKNKGSLEELLELIKNRGIPLLPLSMEWGGAFDDTIMFENPGKAYREIMGVINKTSAHKPEHR